MNPRKLIATGIGIVLVLAAVLVWYQSAHETSDPESTRPQGSVTGPSVSPSETVKTEIPKTDAAHDDPRQPPSESARIETPKTEAEPSVLRGDSPKTGETPSLRPLDRPKTKADPPSSLYVKLPSAQPTSDPEKIEVVEVFWYGCPHCSRFQPYLERWTETLPDHVRFVRMPAIFNDVWELHARAYYIAAALGILGDIHHLIFSAIHDEGRSLATMDAIRDLFIERGVAGSDFDRHARSFSVQSGVQRSLVMQGRYGLRGVPALIVNGRFLVSGATAGSYPRVLEVTDALIAREHAAAGG